MPRLQKTFSFSSELLHLGGCFYTGFLGLAFFALCFALGLLGYHQLAPTALKGGTP